MNCPLIFLSTLIFIQIVRASSLVAQNEPESLDLSSDEEENRENREPTSQNFEKLISDLAILSRKLKNVEPKPKKLVEKSYLNKKRNSLTERDDLFEMEFCSGCFLTQTDSDECLYCHLKYLYKTSKRTKPSSKYWYTRAGK